MGDGGTFHVVAAPKKREMENCVPIELIVSAQKVRQVLRLIPRSTTHFHPNEQKNFRGSRSDMVLQALPSICLSFFFLPHSPQHHHQRASRTLNEIRIKNRRIYLDMGTLLVWGHNPTGSGGVMAAKSILHFGTNKHAPPAGPHNHVLVHFIWMDMVYLDELVVQGCPMQQGPKKKIYPKRTSSLPERREYSLAPMMSIQQHKVAEIIYYYISQGKKK